MMKRSITIASGKLKKEIEDAYKNGSVPSLIHRPERSKREDLTTMSPLPKDLEKRLVDKWKKELLR